MMHEIKGVNTDSTFGGPNYANKETGNFFEHVISSLYSTMLTYILTYIHTHTHSLRLSSKLHYINNCKQCQSTQGASNKQLTKYTDVCSTETVLCQVLAVFLLLSF